MCEDEQLEVCESEVYHASWAKIEEPWRRHIVTLFFSGISWVVRRCGR